MSRKRHRHFTDDFKQQILDLHKANMKRDELIKAYDPAPSTFDKWIRQAKTTGSCKAVDNLIDEQHGLTNLRKRNKELEMKLDILKQAAVIMARKEKSSLLTRVNIAFQLCVVAEYATIELLLQSCRASI